MLSGALIECKGFRYRLCGVFFKITFFSKDIFRNTIRVSKVLDPNQDWQNTNCLQRFTADDKSRCLQRKSEIEIYTFSSGLQIFFSRLVG